MRLTIINQFYTPDISPTAHLASSLANHRAETGDEVTIVTSRGGYVRESENAESDHATNPRVYRLWTPRLSKSNVFKRCIDYGTFYLLAAWRLLRLPSQDVIITLTTPPYIAWTAIIHKMLHRQTKIILWNMDCYPELAERSDKLKTNGLLAEIMRVMNRVVFRCLDHLVCLDTAMVDLLMSQYAPKGHNLPVSVIPNWEKASFYPADAMLEPWDKSEKLGLTNRFVVLYLGNMGYGHRFETVLDAAELLQNEPVSFLFVGGGQRLEWLSEQVEQRKLTNVVMHGYVQEKEQTLQIMKSAQCALITLRDEILGVMSPSKLHSNLAMRLPIIYIGPKKSNVDDAIRNFQCGISLRHGQSQEMADFILKLRDDQKLRSKMGVRARRAFDETYNDEQTLPMFDEVIEILIGVQTQRNATGSARDSAAPKNEDANVTIRS